ncbi:MAG: ATP-binding cassette domain-containing protein [Eubacteriales bacterium]
MSVILETRDLEVRFGKVKAVDAVSLQVERGETLGIVGESGCGKTTFGKTVLGLQKANGGQIFYEGRRIDGLRGRQLLPYRRKMQMVFQDPYGSLDPRMSVYDIVKEGHELREKADGQERDPMLESLLQTVGLDPAFCTAIPGSSAAARDSGWELPGRWRWIRPFWSATSRCRPWTCPSGRRSSIC